MPQFVTYLTSVLRKQNIEKYEFAVSLLTTSNDLVHLEVALRECELALLGKVEELSGPHIRQSLPCYEGYNIDIVGQEVVIEFLYGEKYPQTEECRVPLSLYQSLLLDYYYHVKGPETFPNGNMKMTGRMENYLRYGLWTEYYENGRKKSEGEYVNSQKVGTWRYFYENGRMSGIEYYDEGGYNTGTWEYWYENGKKKSEHNFKYGSYCGDNKYWYESGAIRRHHRYGGDNHYLDGEQCEWYENGNLKSVFVIQDKKTVEYRYYDEQGKLMSKSKS